MLTVLVSHVICEAISLHRGVLRSCSCVGIICDCSAFMCCSIMTTFQLLGLRTACSTMGCGCGRSRRTAAMACASLRPTATTAGSPLSCRCDAHVRWEG